MGILGALSPHCALRCVFLEDKLPPHHHYDYDKDQHRQHHHSRTLTSEFIRCVEFLDPHHLG
ncbi:hypothetical protein BC835DRAFT_1392623 [Cytidiella melzeri]|nr:hypothetical protein BC835DRAFT_1392623 [Cytidiella melzeri]